MRAMRERFCLSGIVLWVLSPVGKSEVGLDGGVGGMMVIELLAGTMRLDRISPEAVGRVAKRSLEGCKITAGEMRGERNGECDYIRNV